MLGHRSSELIHAGRQTAARVRKSILGHRSGELDFAELAPIPVGVLHALLVGWPRGHPLDAFISVLVNHGSAKIVLESLQRLEVAVVFLLELAARVPGDVQHILHRGDRPLDVPQVLVKTSYPTRRFLNRVRLFALALLLYVFLLL